MKNIYDVERWKTFVERLFEMTSKDEILWKDWSQRTSRPDSRTPLYVAEHKEWRILIYGYSYKHYYEEDAYELRQGVSLELVDHTGRAEWIVPKVPGFADLLDLIQYKRINVESLLTDVLGSQR